MTFFTSLSALLLGASSFAAAATCPSTRNAYFSTQQDGAILTITLNNTLSPVNLLDFQGAQKLDQTFTDLQTDKETKVVIFRSGNPKFFAAHYDVMTEPGDAIPISSPQDDVFIVNWLYNLTTLPQATIGVLDGVARGTGSDFALALDMRYSSPATKIANVEVILGELAGGGGNYLVPANLNRARSLEHLFGGQDLDAYTAEKYGLINKVFPNSGALDAYVAQFSKRIATFDYAAIAAAKNFVNHITLPTKGIVNEEYQKWNTLLATAPVQEKVAKFLELSKNETDVTFELNLPSSLLEIYN